MQRLYIDRKNTKLAVNRQRLQVKWEGEVKTHSFPLSQISQLVILTKTEFASSDLLALNSAEIDILCIHSRNYEKSTITSSFRHGNFGRQFKQYQFIMSDHALYLAKYIIQVKLLRQLRVLKQGLHKRPELRFTLLKSIKEIVASIESVKNVQSIGSIRGIEGNAARAYFKGFVGLFSSSLDFTHRNKRPPKDPVNALLSLGYTLIHNDCVRSIQSVGLDPRFGVLHDNSYSRQSLACDLMEIYRPLYDKVVWRWCAEQRFIKNDFAVTPNGCFLNKEARSKYFGYFEKVAKKWRKSQISLLVKWHKELNELII